RAVDMGTRVTVRPPTVSRSGSSPLSCAGGTRWTRWTSWPSRAIARASETTKPPTDGRSGVGNQVVTASTRMGPNLAQEAPRSVAYVGRGEHLHAPAGTTHP